MCVDILLGLQKPLLELMDPRPLLLYIDRYHGGDILFLQALARALAERPQSHPLVLLHGAGDEAERLLEARGFYPERSEEGIKVSTNEERDLVERAVREAGRKIAGVLTESLVPSVPMAGSDRGLLVATRDTPLHAGNAGWVDALLRGGVIPVVSALAFDPISARIFQCSPADALIALAGALNAFGVAIVLVSRKQKERDLDEDSLDLDLDNLVEINGIRQPDIAAKVAASGCRVMGVTPAMVRTLVPAQWPQIVHAGDGRTLE